MHASQDLKPELVYARISGYGQTGPKSHLPGYASVCEAYGGFRYVVTAPRVTCTATMPFALCHAIVLCTEKADLQHASCSIQAAAGCQVVTCSASILLDVSAWCLRLQVVCCK